MHIVCPVLLLDCHVHGARCQMVSQHVSHDARAKADAVPLTRPNHACHTHADATCHTSQAPQQVSVSWTDIPVLGAWWLMLSGCAKKPLLCGRCGKQSNKHAEIINPTQSTWQEPTARECARERPPRVDSSHQVVHCTSAHTVELQALWPKNVMWKSLYASGSGQKSLGCSCKPTFNRSSSRTIDT